MTRPRTNNRIADLKMFRFDTTCENKRFFKTDASQGVVGNIVAGIIGGLVGGFVFGLIGGEGFSGFNLWSFLVALVGAVIVLTIWKAITGRKA